MNNERNNLIRYAMEKIKRDQKYKPECCVFLPTGGTVGPTGPTAPLFKSSNRIIETLSSFYLY